MRPTLLIGIVVLFLSGIIYASPEDSPASQGPDLTVSDSMVRNLTPPLKLDGSEPEGTNYLQTIREFLDQNRRLELLVVGGRIHNLKKSVAEEDLTGNADHENGNKLRESWGKVVMDLRAEGGDSESPDGHNDEARRIENALDLRD